MVRMMASMAFRLLAFMVLLFAVVIDSSAANCPQIFRRFNIQHTFCLSKKPGCNIIVDAIAKDDIAVVLDEHNKYRSNLAIGKVRELPLTSDMMQMVWDQELADIAQKHAEQCEFEHDDKTARRVKNFAVGQNLYTDTVTGSKTPPKANWTAAVKAWYDEINLFDKEYINPFIPSPPGDDTYGHFSQVMWGTSWKIGCGYTMYKEAENSFTGLYVCNYGPSGNIKSGVMYEEGERCQKCPLNSCCDESCKNKKVSNNYPGLCHMIYNEAPRYKSKEGTTFSCEFRGEPDCGFTVSEESNKWQLVETLSGNYMSIVLNGGETSTISFTTPLTGKNGICFSYFYRKGPNDARDKAQNTAIQKYNVVENEFEFSSELKGGSGNFEYFSMTLNWDAKTKFSFTFSVPEGASPQFFEIKDLKAQNGACAKKKIKAS